MSTTKPGPRVQRVLWAAVGLLALIGVVVVVRRTALLVPVLLDGYQPPAATAAPTAALDDIFARYPLLTLIHIIPGLLFMILWPLQFSATLRRRALRWHRRSGRVAVICGLIIGVSALVMSVGMPAIGGLNQAVSTLVFGVFFLVALGKAFWHIRRREIALHREWMIRAFSIGLAVATIRPIIGMFFATSRVSGLTPSEFFGPAFWIGFTLHVIAAEAWIHWTRPKMTTSQQARQPLRG